MGDGAAPGCSLATSGGGWNKTNTTIYTGVKKVKHKSLFFKGKVHTKVK